MNTVRRRIPASRLVTLTILLLFPATSAAQGGNGDVFTSTESELRDLVELYTSDRRALLRRYDVPFSTARRQRMSRFYGDWQERTAGLPWTSLSPEARIDATLLESEIRYELERLNRESRLRAEMEPLVPIADTVIGLQEARHRLEDVDPQAAAGRLAAIPELLDDVKAALDGSAGQNTPSRIVALRAVDWLQDLSEELENWYGHYAEYDPAFTWWVEQPAGEAIEAIEDYTGYLKKEVVGFEDGEDPPIIGDPIGAEGLQADLVHEMIPYTAEELVAIADAEFAWCEREMQRASADLGSGTEWKHALEHVKSLHVAPGEQPGLVRRLAREAIDYLRSRDLVTVPPLAEEVWRMTMLSPERQKVAPFFLGGEVVQVSYPTSGMTHDDKIMSMRGNNIHFSRAVVQHELIPGHHLQGFMNDRFNTHRRAFRTPFWTEGWALYWEMLLWDEGFPQSAEDRVGMLFWRMHRAARIIFSLRFHLGTMTPEEAIDLLVDRVGHERANATAEVRRSFNGTYLPLYQAAYMLGGLQFRKLHEELVGGGTMTNRQFHDRILRAGPMPVEMVRALLLNEPPARGFVTSWRFYGDPLD